MLALQTNKSNMEQGRPHKSCKTCKPACSHRETSGATFWSELIKVTSAGGAIGPQRHIWCHILPFFWSMNFFDLQNCGYFRKHNQNWPIFVFLTLLCIVLGLCCQIMSRITLFSCQILCRESRCFGATFQPLDSQGKLIHGHHFGGQMIAHLN